MQFSAYNNNYRNGSSSSQPFFRLVKDFDAYCSQKSPKNSTSPNSERGSSGDTPSSRCTVEYLADLLRERKQLSIFPRAFQHIEHLVDEEVARVRMALFSFDFSLEELHLPEPEGEPMTVQDKVYIPHKDFPDYNFVGRILGPRGMTAKQLEQETDCKIMVRGKGSIRDPKKENANRGKPNWEHLDDELHVLIECEDTPNRVYTKIKAAVDQVKKLLVPAPEGVDELKRKQLMELSVINGTYKGTGMKYTTPPSRMLTPVTVLSPIRGGGVPSQPIFVSPAGSPITPGVNTSANGGSYMQSPNIDFNMLVNQLSLDTSVASYPMMGDYQQRGSQMFSTFPVSTPTALQPYFIDSAPITPPGSLGSASH